MTRISRDRWEVLSPLFDEAVALPEAERRVWLEAQRRSDPGLAAALEEMLRHEARLDPEKFLSPDVRPGLPDAAVSLAGRTLGPWMLERPLGQGGMGTVWLARRADGRFEGQAAVKLLNLALLSASGQERFRREGSVLARLTHAGIARLLDAGVSETGQPYLVLEYVDGQPIDVYVREQKLPQPALLRLFLQVLAAVGHAHANLVVHRDLKPSNIFVTDDGTVKLLDFGIAKLIDVETGDVLTSEGSRALTPRYAAPEQVRGEPLSTATDVYALGVLLYLLLSGRHPTAAEHSTPAQSASALLLVEPARLRLGDLDNILAKALRKESAERYQTVAAFGDDLERYLRQEPVSVRADSLAYRMGKFVRRNRGGVAAGALITLGLALATLFSVIQMREARVQRDAALRESRRADAQLEFQRVLLSQVGDKPVTMHQAIDSGRVVLERQFARDSEVLPSLLLQLASSYADLGETKLSATLLARAESLALAGHGTEGLAGIRCTIADNLRMQGEYKAAWRALEAADSLLRTTPNRDDELNCLQVRAHLAYEQGRGKEAVVAARRALAITDSLGETHDLAYSSLLGTLASALVAEGQPREAVTLFRRAIAGMDRAGGGAMMDRTILWHNLALAQASLGNTLEAEQILREVLGKAAAADPSGRIYWQPLIHYAEAALVQEHVDTALKYFRKVVSQAVSDGNLFWEGRGLYGVARAAIRLGRLAEARQARARLEQIIAKYPHVRDTDDVLPDGGTLTGMLALATGEAGSAWAAFQEALRGNGYFEGKFRQKLRPVALLAAEAGLALGKLDEADDLARQARETATVDSASDSLSARVGEARLIEGRVLLARRDTLRARTTLARALTALRSGAGPDHPRTRAARALSDSLGGEN